MMAAVSRSPSRLSARLVTCDHPAHGALNSGRKVTMSSTGMLWDASAINGYAIEASDGRIGTVSDLLFEEVSWVVLPLLRQRLAQRPPRRKLARYVLEAVVARCAAGSGRPSNPRRACPLIVGTTPGTQKGPHVLLVLLIGVKTEPAPHYGFLWPV
jgi:hypothetical protein